MGKKAKIPKKFVDGTSWKKGAKDKGEMTIDLWVTKEQYDKLTDRLMK